MKNIIIFMLLLGALTLSFFPMPREWLAVSLVIVVCLQWAFVIRHNGLLALDRGFCFLGVAWLAAVSLPLLAPGWYKDRSWGEIPEQVLDSAALWMVRGWTAACISYYGTHIVASLLGGRSRLEKRTHVDEKGAPAGSSKAIELLGVASAAGVIVYVLATGGNLFEYTELGRVEDSAWRQMLWLLIDGGILFIYLSLTYPDGTRRRKVINFLWALIWITFALFNGQKRLILSGLMAAFLAGQFVKRKATRRLKVAGRAGAVIVVMIVLFFIGAAHRNALMSEYANLGQESFGGRLATVASAFASGVKTLLSEGTTGWGYYEVYEISNVLDRLAHIAGFAYVLLLTSGEPPMEDTIETVFAPVIGNLPRGIWLEKPSYLDAGRFAQYFGWSHGGVSPTLPGSLYWAWGYAGIPIGMGIIGVMLCCLQFLTLRNGGRNVVALGCFVYCIINLIDVGVTYQAVAVGLPRVMALLLFLSVIGEWAGRRGRGGRPGLQGVRSSTKGKKGDVYFGAPSVPAGRTSALNGTGRIQGASRSENS